MYTLRNKIDTTLGIKEENIINIRPAMPGLLSIQLREEAEETALWASSLCRLRSINTRKNNTHKGIIRSCIAALAVMPVVYVIGMLIALL